MRGCPTATLLAFVLILPSTRAQDNAPTMSGIVTDSQSRKPVEGATVTVVGNKANQESTDRDGKFVLTFSASTHQGDRVRIRVLKPNYRVWENYEPVSSTIPLPVSLEPIVSHSKGNSPSLVTASIKTRIVSQLYAQAAAPPPGQTANIPLSFQELFYEWSVVLTAGHQAAASLKVDHLQRNDTFRVNPEGAKTDIVEETPLGFKTLGTNKPDHYALLVKADDLSQTQPLIVTVRRSIAVPLVDSDLVGLAYVRSASSAVQEPTYDVKADIERLNRQLAIISGWHYGPNLLPVAAHPLEGPPAGAMRTTLETSCIDESCKRLNMGNLVAEWNRVNVGDEKPEWSAEGTKVIRNVAASKQGKWVSLTIDTSQLSSFAQDYNLMIIVRVLDNHIEALTDPGIAKSSLFTITGEVRTIEVQLTDGFIARSDAVSQNHNQMSLQIYLALIPKRIRADQILTIADITAVGGQQLRSSPQPEITSPTPFE